MVSEWKGPQYEKLFYFHLQNIQYVAKNCTKSQMLIPLMIRVFFYNKQTFFTILYRTQQVEMKVGCFHLIHFVDSKFLQKLETFFCQNTRLRVPLPGNIQVLFSTLSFFTWLPLASSSICQIIFVLSLKTEQTEALFPSLT